MLTPGQAESISEELLAGERREQGSRPRVRLDTWIDGIEGLERVAPNRRAAIVRAARRNVNNRWTTALVYGGPIAIYAGVMGLWGDAIPDLAGIALPLALFAPAIAVHMRLVRREIEALVERESTGR